MAVRHHTVPCPAIPGFRPEPPIHSQRQHESPYLQGFPGAFNLSSHPLYSRGTSATMHYRTRLSQSRAPAPADGFPVRLESLSSSSSRQPAGQASGGGAPATRACLEPLSAGAWSPTVPWGQIHHLVAALHQAGAAGGSSGPSPPPGAGSPSWPYLI